MTDRPSPPSTNAFVRAMWIALAICIVLVVFGNPLVGAGGALGAALAIWNLTTFVPGKVSRALEGRSRLAFTLAAAVLFPLILSLYFLKGVSAFDPLWSIRHFMGWYALIPIVVIGYISMAVGHTTIDKDHPVTGLLIAACLLFVPMFLGYHGIDLSTDDYGYPTSDPIDPAVLKAKQRAGYDFVIYWLYVGISYTGIAIGLARKRAEDRKLDAAIARTRKP